MNKRSLLSLAGLVLTLGTYQSHAQFFREPFDYADGEIGAVSGGTWVPNAGTALNISNGAAVINQGDLVGGRERASRAISTPFTTTANSVAWVGFTATWTSLPLTVNGSYFVNFSASTGSETFFGRIGADTAGAADGKFRVAVANANWTANNSIEFQQDLSLNVAYRIVAKYDLTTRNTTLWIDPASEASTSVTATDAPVGAQLDITAINLRQGRSANNTGAPGVIRIDDLAVGSSFGQVAPVPEPATLSAIAGSGLLAFGLLRKRLSK
jgi:hypothetical protein